VVPASRGCGARDPGNAFDRNPATQWFYSGVGGWLQYDLGLGHAQIVRRYTVTSPLMRPR